MAEHIIEYDEECRQCDGTGLYVGMAEKHGLAVVCHQCAGTGKHHTRWVYRDFEGRKLRAGITRVIECNPGVIMAPVKGIGLSYADWQAGKPFARGTEPRQDVCPKWWLQCMNVSADWPECIQWGGAFSECWRFRDKWRCWKRYDAEEDAKEASQ